MDEVAAQLQGLTPDLVVLSVGGGGLMNGVLAGMQRVGWTAVPVLAVETEGAHSLNACVRANRWVELNKITRYVTGRKQLLLIHASCPPPSALQHVWVQNGSARGHSSGSPNTQS